LQRNNRDTGARTIEMNKVEYLIRSVGAVNSVAEIENMVIRAPENKPIYIHDVASVSFGPAERRGLLDDGGAEAVGAVVTIRHDANPQEVIDAVKEKIAQLELALPTRELSDGNRATLRIKAFY